jgi:sec-independent protein translocase protein TatB
MRRVGQFIARMRSMAMEFRASFDEMARQSELDELRREVEAMRAAAHQPIATAVDPMGLQQVHSDIHGALYDQVAEPHAEPAPAVTAESPPAENAPKPRRRRAKKAASEPGAEPPPSSETLP